MTNPRDESPEVKKNYAKEQYAFLKKQGITERLRLSRIFKAAGPGQIQEAWKLATCEDWTTEDGKVSKDILECLLRGILVRQTTSAGQIGSMLETLDFYIPAIEDAPRMHRVLRGALEILVPDSVRFSSKELAEIENGLHKHIGTDGAQPTE